MLLQWFCSFAELVTSELTVFFFVWHFSIPAGSPSPGKASSASVTALPNGLTIVTEDAASTSTVSLTFPGAGSASETMGEQGAALLNKCMAFKSGSGVSSLVLMRILEDNGAQFFSSVGRTSATVGYTATPDNAPKLISLLATNCTYEKWDLRDAKKAASIIVEDAASNAQVCLLLLRTTYVFTFFLNLTYALLSVDCPDRTALCGRVWRTVLDGTTTLLG